MKLRQFVGGGKDKTISVRLSNPRERITFKVGTGVFMFDSAHVSPRKKLCILSPAGMTVEAFLEPHLRGLMDDFEVTLISGPRGPGFGSLLDDRLVTVQIEITRQPNLRLDIGAFFKLLGFFYSKKFDGLLTLHPKGGFLGNVAGAFAGIPLRIHWFTGQVWATKKGASRLILMIADWITSLLATQTLADSRGQQNFLEKNRVVKKGQCTVLGNGSVSGVNLGRFRADPTARQATRNELGIPNTAVVLIFLGRLTKDKGVFDLAEALSNLRPRDHRLHILWVGPDEGQAATEIRSRANSSFVTSHFIGQTNSPERYVNAADLLVLPSHREGFGTSVIEAAAAGLPSVVSDIYGLADATVPGKTGISFRAGEISGLTLSIEILVRSPAMRERLGHNAHARAVKDFSSDLVTEELRHLLREKLGLQVLNQQSTSQGEL